MCLALGGDPLAKMQQRARNEMNMYQQGIMADNVETVDTLPKTDYILPERAKMLQQIGQPAECTIYMDNQLKVMEPERNKRIRGAKQEKELEEWERKVKTNHPDVTAETYNKNLTNLSINDISESIFSSSKNQGLLTINEMKAESKNISEPKSSQTSSISLRFEGVTSNKESVKDNDENNIFSDLENSSLQEQVFSGINSNTDSSDSWLNGSFNN